VHQHASDQGRRQPPSRRSVGAHSTHGRKKKANTAIRQVVAAQTSIRQPTGDSRMMKQPYRDSRARPARGISPPQFTAGGRQECGPEQRRTRSPEVGAVAADRKKERERRNTRRSRRAVTTHGYANTFHRRSPMPSASGKHAVVPHFATKSRNPREACWPETVDEPTKLAAAHHRKGVRNRTPATLVVAGRDAAGLLSLESRARLPIPELAWTGSTGSASAAPSARQFPRAGAAP